MVTETWEKRLKESRTAVWGVALAVVLLSRILLFAVYWQWKNEMGSDAGIFRALMQWDCGWYASIAENGYTRVENLSGFGQASWAFFPLVPLLEGVLSRLSGLPVRVVGVVMNTAFLYLLTVFGAKLCLDTDSGSWQQALALMFLFNFGPYNVYYSTLYTECLFALLVCLSLYCMYRNHWLAMGVFGALLGATRNTGVFLPFVIPFYCLGQYLAMPGKKTVSGFFKWLLDRPRLILGTFLMPMGFFLFMRYLDGLVGDGFAFMHVQYAWDRFLGNPLTNLWDALMLLGTDDFFHAFCAVIGLYLAIRQLSRRRPEGVLALIFVVIPLCTSAYGMARYALCSFPILLEASHALSCRTRTEKLCSGLILMALGIITSYWWFRGSIMLM